MDQKHHIFIQFLTPFYGDIVLQYGLPSKLGNFLTVRDICIFKSGCSTSSYTKTCKNDLDPLTSHMLISVIYMLTLLTLWWILYIFECYCRSLICRGHQTISRISKKFHSLLILNFLLRKVKAIGGVRGHFCKWSLFKSTQSCGVTAFYGIKIQNFVAKIFTFKVTAPLTFV